MAKKMASFKLDQEVLDALAETSASVGMSKSGFVNLLVGSACGVYPTAEVLGTMFDSAKASKEAQAAISDPYDYVRA